MNIQWFKSLKISCYQQSIMKLFGVYINIEFISLKDYTW